MKMENAYESNGIFSMTEKEERKPKAAKRVNIVSVRLVKESSMLYKRRSISSPADGYEIFKEFLEDLDREAFVCHFIGYEKPTIVHQRCTYRQYQFKYCFSCLRHACCALKQCSVNHGWA